MTKIKDFLNTIHLKSFFYGIILVVILYVLLIISKILFYRGRKMKGLYPKYVRK